MKQHCSACVFPGSEGLSSGSSMDHPVDRIWFLSASTSTAPTQNLLGAGGDKRACSRAYSMYLLWSPAGMAGWDISEAIVRIGHARRSHVRGLIIDGRLDITEVGNSRGHALSSPCSSSVRALEI